MDLTTASLKGASVLVTGGASGIGAACVRDFARAGALVIIADYNRKQSNELEAELTKAGYSVKAIYVDVCWAPSQATMILAALEWLPQGQGIDHAVFCAGITGGYFDLRAGDPAKLKLDLDRDDMRSRLTSAIHVNLLGLLEGVQLVVKYGMGLPHDAPLPQPPGIASAQSSAPSQKRDKSIVLMGSIASYRALPPSTGYTASKFGVRGVFRTLRSCLPELGVRINLIAPGFIKTTLMGASTMAYLHDVGTRFGDVGTVAEAVLRVCKDAECHGRALGVVQEGIQDLNDDNAGKDGFVVLEDMAQRQAFHHGERGVLFEY